MINECKGINTNATEHCWHNVTKYVYQQHGPFAPIGETITTGGFSVVCGSICCNCGEKK